MIPTCANMLAGTQNTITLRRLMDEGAIVICISPRVEHGESTAHLLVLALSGHDLCAGRVCRAPTHPPACARRTSILFRRIQSFATEAFALILSEVAQVRSTLT